MLTLSSSQLVWSFFKRTFYDRCSFLETNKQKQTKNKQKRVDKMFLMFII